MEHNYQKIGFSAVVGEAKDGEERKIDWKLEVLKKNKVKADELMSWFSKESEWQDLKLLINILRNSEKAVLNIKAEREGLKNLSLFVIKEVNDVKIDVTTTPEVDALLEALPEVAGEIESTTAT